jgi:hypothetical protein
MSDIASVSTSAVPPFAESGAGVAGAGAGTEAAEAGGDDDDACADEDMTNPCPGTKVGAAAEGVHEEALGFIRFLSVQFPLRRYVCKSFAMVQRLGE